MRTFKDDALSFLSQVFLFRGGAHLSVGVIAGFTLKEKPELLPEPDCMAAIKDGLGKDILFDACMPKPLGEILVAGKCFAPGGKPVRTVVPAMRVGPVVKRLAVFGNRRWNKLGEMKTAISEPKPFTEMEISWKRAFGGPEYELNPEGMGLAGEPLPLPNVEIPGCLIAAPGDRPPPAGFGPMGMGWPGRLKGLGTFDDAWKKLAWPAYPDDFNFLYFNRAPADQRIEGWFRGDEPVETDHLHPERTYIRSCLPGVRVRGFAARREKGTEYFVEMDMRLETVWLLPNALTGFLIWRGVTPSADDEASNIPFVAAFTEPLDTIPESLEHYLARVRSMEAGEGAFAVAEVPAAKEAGVEAAGIPSVPGLPGVQIPGVPGAGRVAAAGIAGVAGVAVPAMAEEKAGPQETGLPGAVPEVPGAAPEIPAEEGPEAAGAVAPPPAEGLQKPLIVHSAEEIPKVEIPEFPPLEELAGHTAFEKKTEDMLREALAIPPDEPLFQEPPPLPDMTPEALQAHMESLAAQAEAEARRFFGERGFNPDAPVEYPEAHPELAKLMDMKPIPETTPFGQIPQLLQDMSGDFRKRFDDLAKKHNIDPNTLFPEERQLPFTNAAELERHLRSTGLDNPDLFEELRKIDLLQKEADSRLRQYFAITGTPLTASTAGPGNDAMGMGAGDTASDGELREFIKQLAAGTVPGLYDHQKAAESLAGGEGPISGTDSGKIAGSGVDGAGSFPGEDAEPRPEPPSRDDILKRLEAGEAFAGTSLAGANLAETKLSDRDFTGTDFSGANLEKADFTNSDLTGANFSGAILTGAIFTGAKPLRAIFSGVSGSGSNFAGVSPSGADFSGGDFTGADFTGSDMTGANLSGAVFDGAKMKGAVVRNAGASKARFAQADLTGADLSGATLPEADFTGATLDTTVFSDAILTNAWFSGTHGAGTVFAGADMRTSRADGATSLPSADFTGAILADARWADADLSGAHFHGDDLTGASFMGCTFAGADLGGITARGAVFQKSDFTGAVVSGSDLFKCSLRKADLTRADFGDTNLYEADLYMATVTDTRFEGANLSGTLLSEWRPDA